MKSNFLKRLGILPHQEAPFLFLWGVRFWSHLGLFFSWTVLLALFVEDFGIRALLIFFLLESGFSVLGNLLVTPFFLRWGVDQFLKFMVLGGSLCLVLAFAFQSNNLLFLGILLIGRTFFAGPLGTGIARKTEALVTPHEAEKMMPLLDSASTIAMLASAGLLLGGLSFLPLSEVIYLWALVFLGLASLLWFSEKKLQEVPSLFKIHQNQPHAPSIGIVGLISRHRFLMSLTIILLMQSFVWTLTETIFTRELYHNSHPEASEVFINASFLKADFLHAPKKAFQDIKEPVERLVHTISGEVMAHESLAHDLGWFNLLVGVLALLVQVFLASRVLNFFGVVGSMIFFWIGFLGLNLMSLFTGGGIHWLRAYHHSNHAIFQTGYHLTFYSMRSGERERLRQWFEGILKPLGVIVFSVVIILGELFSGYSFPWVLETILGLSILSLGVLWWAKGLYTDLTQETFSDAQLVEHQLHLVEILGQKGHKNAVEIFGEALLKKELNPIVRERIIQGMPELGDGRILVPFMRVLEDETEEDIFKIKILESLLEFPSLKVYLAEHPFSRYQLVSWLEKILEKEAHRHLQKLALMNLFRHRASHELVPFFLEQIRNPKDAHMQSVCLRSASEIFEDPAMTPYIEPFLNDEDPKLKGHAIIALWKLGDRDLLRAHLEALLQGETEEEVIAALYALGEIGGGFWREAVLSFSEDSRTKVRLHALVALAKMGEVSATRGLLELLFGPDQKISQDVFSMLKRTAPEFQSLLKKEIGHQVSQEVLKILQKEPDRSLPVCFERLKHLYRLSERYDDLYALHQFSS